MSLVGGGIEPKLEEKEAPLFLCPVPVAMTLNCLRECRQSYRLCRGEEKTATGASALLNLPLVL